MTSSSIIRQDIETIAGAIAGEASLLSGKTVLLTGSAGFLGRYFMGVFHHLNRHVLAEPCHVISVDNFITGSRMADFDFYDDPHVQDMQANAAEPLSIDLPIDYIIHAAGLASPVYYQKYPLETIESAVTGAKNLLEHARTQDLKGFLFFSSSEIYGDPDPSVIPIPETYCGNVSSIGPRACYDESKRLAETLCTVYHQQFGIPTKIVRPFNVFGPGMKPDDRRVVPMFVFRLLNGQPLPVHGDGHQTRTFCYITDAMAGFFKALLVGKPGDVYNIGNGDDEISMRNLASLLTTMGKEEGNFELVSYPAAYPAGEPQRRCPDTKKAERELKYVARVSLQEGLRRTLDWCRCQPEYIVHAAPAAKREEVVQKS